MDKSQVLPLPKKFIRIRSLLQKPSPKFIKKFIPKEHMENWDNVKKIFVKRYYYWQVYAVADLIGSFVQFIGQYYCDFWDYIQDIIFGQSNIKLPVMILMDPPRGSQMRVRVWNRTCTRRVRFYQTGPIP